MLRLRARVLVPALRDSRSCWAIHERDRDGNVSAEAVVWDGFHTTWGATYVRAADGRAWVDYDGEEEHFHQHGLMALAVSDVREDIGWNLLPEGHLARIKASGAIIGAVNKSRVRARRPAACTMYRWVNGGWDRALCEQVWFDGEVATVTVPNGREHGLVDDREPLLAWLEGFKVMDI